MKLVLVRHGYTVGNDQGLYTGWSNTILSRKGIEDLKQYRKEYDYPKTDRYYTSDLVRTIDTFHLLYGEETPIKESTFAFREIGFGDYEDLKWNEIDDVPYNDMYILNKPHVNGETISQVTLRLFGKLTQVFSDMSKNGEDSVTIVCHSGVIKTILIFLKSLPFSDFKEIATPNGLGYILDIDFDIENNFLTLNRYEPIPKKK
ncbi:histidine phosphatase family protein [Erysipelothrix sp. HDW6A]|uniref:histidine phosphatase family protein n=1 Tax=Erysipelothrix sp. HDW6A TaxID=2714928 RepID=UPI00140E8169|nr:histidine phosphatase family protein [Erysipelothrix sp. HDW6A]QIK56572.1 histidine phosphatase family protein [Erysipelothrix sp. HDW6A]